VDFLWEGEMTRLLVSRPKLVDDDGLERQEFNKKKAIFEQDIFHEVVMVKRKRFDEHAYEKGGQGGKQHH
jgi:hypothetical protein